MIGDRLTKVVLRLLAVLLLCIPLQAGADQADIDAAARGVVRVVIVQMDGEQVIPISHGTGFAVGPERIVTNAHVIREAQEDEELAIAIVPSDGENPVYAQLVSANPRTDL